MTNVIFNPFDDLNMRRDKLMFKRKTEASAKSVSAKSPSELKSGIALDAKEQIHKGKAKSPEVIRVWAYQKWEAAGKPTGDGVNFWLEAERELLQAM
jgi:hypothetical protein